MKRIIFAAALVLSFGAAIADEKPAALPSDLAWIPPNCAAFAHVRFAELWKSDSGTAISKRVASSDTRVLADIEQFLGVQLEQIDLLTVVVPSVYQGLDFVENIVLRVTTLAPYDEKKVLQALGVDNTSPRTTDSTQSFYRLPRNRGRVHLSDGKNITIFFGDGAAVGLLGKLLDSRPSGMESEFIQIANETHHLIIGANVSRLHDLLHGGGSPFDRRLLGARIAVLTGDLKSDSAEVNLRLTYRRRTFADQGAEALVALKESFEKSLTRNIGELQGDKGMAGRIRILEALVAGIRNAKIDQSNLQVSARVRIETKEAMKVFASEGTTVLTAASRRKASQNSLRFLALAMHNYASARGRLPEAAICDKNGKPLLSWRVAILPYLEFDNLYRQFHFDEPWDSEHNKTLLKLMPKQFALPGDESKHEMPSTYYRVFVGNGAVFGWRRSPSFEQLTAADGTAGTLLITEAADAVPWTKPEELEYDPKKQPKFGFHIGDHCNFVFADGSAGTLKKNVKERLLHSLIQWKDGQGVRQEDLDK
jgi:hypothetical protein